MKMKRGFTLIELLVVIAVIAILMAILMPALNRAQESGKRANCLANVKNLTLCWTMYTNDNNGRVPGGGTGGTDSSWVNYDGISGWMGYNANLDACVRGIKKGVLWPYTKSEKLYRCPTATRNEGKTYAMPDSYMGKSQRSSVAAIGGEPMTAFIDNINNIKRPGERMAFWDEGVANPGTFSFYYSQPKWWDPVPIRHGDGTCLSFADGHAEYVKWKDPRTIKFGKEALALADPGGAANWGRVEPDNPDVYYLCMVIWGKCVWK
jgi:prepilin-type N-terminal cleavage/methylation domain-containing protein/prepilin-type processing-associated H-X9-DG protein